MIVKNDIVVWLFGRVGELVQKLGPNLIVKKEEDLENRTSDASKF